MPLGDIFRDSLSVQDDSNRVTSYDCRRLEKPEVTSLPFPALCFCSYIILCISSVMPNHPIYTFYVSINMDNSFLSISPVKF